MFNNSALIIYEVKRKLCLVILIDVFVFKYLLCLLGGDWNFETLF